MRKRILAVLLSLLMLATLPLARATQAKTCTNESNEPQSAVSGQSIQALSCDGYGMLPLFFIPNGGQIDERVFFTVSGKDNSVFFTEGGLTLDLSGQVNGEAQERWVLKLDFVGADRAAPESLDASETVVSYFVGRSDEWHTGLQASSRIVYRDLWPGIDLVFSGAYERLKYEFVVHPGADPSLIKLSYTGADLVTPDDSGGLVVSTPVCAFADERPLAFQGDGQIPVEVGYHLDDGGGNGVFSYGFELGAYDAGKTLIIDPALLVYSGLLGGTSNDEASGIAVDPSGAAYVAGKLGYSQEGFPITVGPVLTAAGNGDAFVAKINPAGTELIYCGFIGGTGLDGANCIAVDQNGNAFVGGNTCSADFPVANANWTGADTLKGVSDGFVAKVSADGTQLLCCGYLGGASNEAVAGVAVDSTGNVYAVGDTASTDFPVNGAAWTGASTHSGGISDAFVTKIEADGSALLWSGFLGGSGRDTATCAAADASGVYISGQTRSADYPVANTAWEGASTLKGARDAFVTKIAADGAAISYSGYFGGSLNDDAYAIAVDGSGCAYVTGETSSADLPRSASWTGATTFGGNRDVFVAKINETGEQIVYSGYIGGADWDTGYGIAVDSLGAAFAAGDTRSADFPVCNGAWTNAATLQGGRDAFLAKINPEGTELQYSGFLGGDDFDYARCVAVDGSGAAYLAGYCASSDFPHVTSGWAGAAVRQGGNDAFIAKIAEASAPQVSTGDILDLTATGATVLGRVTADGGDTATERGVVYSTASDPTLETGTAVSADGAGTGEFDAAVVGFFPNTTYYVRAYATNAAGTAYGASRGFRTPVSVTTVAVGSMPKQAAVNRATNKIYVPNNLGSSVSVIDGNTDTVLTTVSLGSGTGPCFAAVNETTNRIYIANNFGNSVSVIDGAADMVAATVPTGNGPRAVAINETTNTIYVANYMASTVTVINGADNTVGTTLNIGAGTRPISLAVNETTNKLYTANYWNNTISVIDCSTGAVDAVIPASAAQNSPRFVAVNEQTSMVYVANFRSRNVTVIDGADNSYEYVTVGVDPWEIAIDQNANKIYVSTDGETTVAVLDGATNAVQKASAGKAPQAIAVNDKTNMIYVGNYNRDDRSAAGFVVTQIDGTTLETVGFANASNPSFLAVNNQTDKVYVVNFDNTVTVIALAPPAPITIAGTATDDTAILQIDNKTPSAEDRTWDVSVTAGTVKEGLTAADVTLTGLPAGLSHTAAKGTGNNIVITLTGAATTALTADASITAVARGSAVTEMGAQDSEGIALKLWRIGADTTFVLTNEAGGLIDKLIAAGHGSKNLYQVMQLLQPVSGGTITDRFMMVLASNQADSEIFTANLNDAAAAANNPVGVNADGTLTVVPIHGSDYYGRTGYSTYPDTPVAGRESFTYAEGPQYYIPAGSSDLGTSYYAFAIAWAASPTPIEVRVLKPTAGAVWTGEQTIEWEAAALDHEASELKISLEYALQSEGSAWQVITANQTNTGKYKWDTSQVGRGGRYKVRVTAADPDGGTAGATSEEFTIVVLAHAVAAAPNPARDSVTFYYDIPADGTLHVCDVAGRLVYSAGLSAAENAHQWNLTAGGRPLANGVYLYIVIYDGGKSEVGRLVVNR